MLVSLAEDSLAVEWIVKLVLIILSIKNKLAKSLKQTEHGPCTVQARSAHNGPSTHCSCTHGPCTVHARSMHSRHTMDTWTVHVPCVHGPRVKINNINILVISKIRSLLYRN